jgi:hypothetical protein
MPIIHSIPNGAPRVSLWNMKGVSSQKLLSEGRSSKPLVIEMKRKLHSLAGIHHQASSQYQYPRILKIIKKTLENTLPASE